MASEPEGSTQRSRGTVKWFNASKGFGFITPEGGGDDLFVHQSTIEAEGFRSLKEGEEVEFLIQPGDEGRFRAIEVTGPNRAPPQGAPRRTGPRAGFPAPGPRFPGYAMPYPLGPGAAAGRGAAQVPFMHPMQAPIGLAPGPSPGMGLPHHHQPPLQQQQPGGGSGPPAVSSGGSGPPAVSSGGSGPPAVSSGGSGPPAVSSGGSGPPAVSSGGSGPPAVSSGPPQQQQEPQRAQQQHQPPQSSAAGESPAAGVQPPSTAQQQQQQQPVRQQPPAPATLAQEAHPQQPPAALRAEPEPAEPGPSSYQQPQQHQHSHLAHHQPHVHQQPQPPHQHQAQLHAHQAAAAAAAAAAAEQQHVAMAQRAAELGGLAQFAPFPYGYGGYPAFWPTPYAIPYGPRGPGRGMPPRAAFLYHPAPMQFMGHQRPPPGTPGVSSGVQVVVHNLPWSTTWQELKDAFAETGPIERADVILDAAGRSRGFGTVRYATKEAAESSALKMNNQKIGGRTITVRIDRFA